MTSERAADAGRTAEARAATARLRGRVVDVLCDAYANDVLDLPELERRLDRATRVRTEAELATLVEDLEVASERGSRPSHRPDGHGGSSLATSGEASPNRPGTVDPARVPDRQYSVAFWSGRARTGSWVPAKRSVAVAFQGGVELDFREALLGPGVTEVKALAFMGAVEIIVPPELHVEVSGFAVMGAFEGGSERSTPPRGDEPMLRVDGFAMLGAVEINAREPGESERQARARRRRQRRERG